ncbi:cytochrome c oxidase accessory protein CcoG [Kordiimonas sediminis]|uniref:Cytochrome c oxidase accessory protein CcoG n=1 Tax=Kordiimonas sediminis TaxID=1735581 RepID=A0A919AQQ1_9PROT|nr:cytochrome c oxidase accessory protein CcoG [Kordiimonas sediminis]GHF19550.1 cytochrome c oxidase accessory protein CcoG [Kordiimonas sediminis]
MTAEKNTDQAAETYKKSPAGTSAGGSVLGTPDAKPAINREEDKVQLYADRVKVFPRRVYGTFRSIKWIVMALSLSIYYLTPWIRFDRGPGVPDQAVLIDMPARKAYFFWIEIWAQEVYYATGLLILAAMILFLMTSLAGRVWCGYACPQTVWTDLFVHIERWIQGDRNQRMKLEKAPWGPSKIFKKFFTHICFMIVSILTGGAFVFYFGDAPTLAVQLVTGDAPMTSYLFIAITAGFTYLLGGIAREQVCIYMCPWPRIQGALVDENSLLVTYNKDRGEDRGPHKKGDTWEGRGDCIDCKQCVAVCPMGIDIRNGFQLECIQCALCVDACNGIMEKIDRPKNLIGYAPTHVDMAGGKVTQETKILRPRIFIYMGMIAIVCGIMLTSLFTRSDIELNVLKDRNPLFVTLSSGEIRNGYTVNILNKQHVDRPVYVRVSGIEGAQIRTAFSEPAKQVKTTVPPDDMRSLRVFVLVDGKIATTGDLADGKGEVTFEVLDENGTLLLDHDSAFNSAGK